MYSIAARSGWGKNPECYQLTFGTTFGSPPGVPGGGMTGVRPPPTGGTEMPGSTPAGGHITPFDSESCSLKLRLPVVSGDRGVVLPASAEHSFRAGGETDGGAAGRSDCARAVGMASIKVAITRPARFSNRMTSLRHCPLNNVECNAIVP
jgi:hypothetical protein